MPARALDVEHALLDCVERIVTDVAGHASVADVKREAGRFASSFAVEVVTVRLDDGDELKVFLKDFGSSLRQRPKPGVPRRRERELAVYRDLLADADLGTPEYYGSVWDESESRFWLMVEFVEGMPVRYLDFDYWVQAGAWLARLEGHCARDPGRLSSCDVLTVQDAEYFEPAADRALSSVSRYSNGLAKQLAPVARGYGALVTTMSAAPRTLVHGTYRPGQIIVDTSRDRVRLAPVDWELAAVGSSLYDLSTIAFGFDDAHLDEMISAYRDEASRQGLAVESADAIKLVLRAYDLHRIMMWLARAPERQFPHEQVVRLTEMATTTGGVVL